MKLQNRDKVKTSIRFSYLNNQFLVDFDNSNNNSEIKNTLRANLFYKLKRNLIDGTLKNRLT